MRGFSRNLISKTNRQIVSAMRVSAPNLARVLPSKLERSQTTNTILLATRYGGDKFKKVAMNAT